MARAAGRVFQALLIAITPPGVLFFFDPHPHLYHCLLPVLTMGSQGLVFKDLLPVPETDPTAHEGTAETLLDAPTDSHALAMEGAKATHPDEAGAAQVAHSEED